MTKFNVNELYYGFRCIEKEDIKDIKSNGYIFKHEKSGAEVMVLENDDENKAFGICFKTAVNDSTGVPHILEHSVLNGSRKFKAKDPFAEMLKISLASFINAFTFPDKTMYPVASKNERDFMNLMDLYMDSVFYPLLTKETFLQEGWHYDIKDKESDLSYKGVVYNEMKGVFSSPDSIIDKMRNRVLFPDTTYSNVSGGDPRVIPELTYEQFVNFHKTKYHPANSKIIIYGNGDTEKYLEFINREYLVGFDVIDVEEEIELQEKQKGIKEKRGYYPISKEEPADKRSYILKSYLLDEVKNRKFDLSFSILSTILAEMDSSPLRRAIIEADIGEGLYGGEYNNYLRQGVYDIGVSGTDIEKNGENMVEKFNSVVEKTLRELVEKGIDKKLIQSAINKNEFALREANFGDFPKGIVYFIEGMRAWLYGGHPFDSIKFEKELAEIKKEAKNGYFEKMIRELLIENTHSALVTLIPDSTLEERNEAEEKEKLKEIKSQMSNEVIEKIIEESRKLEELQVKPNSKEALDTLPKLSITDIEIEPEKAPTEIVEIEGRKLLYHDIATNGIVYFTAGFDFSDFEEKHIQYTALLSSLFRYLGTEKSSSEEIEQELAINTGGIEISRYITEHSKEDRAINQILISGKSVVEKFGTVTDILKDLLNSINCKNIVKIKEIVLKKRTEMKNYIISSGHGAAKSRIGYHLSESGKRQEIMGGISYYYFLEKCIEELEKSPEKIILELKSTADRLFTKDRTIFNLTCDRESFEKIKTNIADLINGIKEKSDLSGISEGTEYEKPEENEGLIIASQVQYVGMGANLKKLGFKKKGKLNVLKKIVDIDYLWQNVRLKGGAYGGFSSYDSMSGEWYFVSYRDPNLKETVDIYKECYKFLENEEISKDELQKTIIGTFQPMEKPLLPDRKGMREFYYYMTGITKDDLIRDREEIVSTTPEDIKEFAKLFKLVSENGLTAVIGSKNKIEGAKEIFGSVKNLFEK
jgi:presequence protease